MCYHYVLSIESNNDGSVFRSENPLYIYRSSTTGDEKKIITSAYPHTTAYLRGNYSTGFGDETDDGPGGTGPGGTGPGGPGGPGGSNF